MKAVKIFSVFAILALSWKIQNHYNVLIRIGGSSQKPILILVFNIVFSRSLKHLNFQILLDFSNTYQSSTNN